MRADILTNQGDVTVTKKWFVDGTQSDVGAVTYVLTDPDGDTVSSGSATKAGSGSSTTYSATIPNQTQVTILTLTWTRTDTGAKLVDTLEVVGGQLFSEAQARAFDEAFLTSESDYSDADIAEERLRITDLLEQWTGRSWIPRWRRLTFMGTGDRVLNLAEYAASQGGSNGTGAVRDIRQILAVTADGSNVATSNVAIQGHLLLRTDTIWPTASWTDPHNVVIDVEYGLPHLMDGVDRIALKLLRDRLPSSRIPDSADRFNDLTGTLDFSAENMGRPTRIPEVNAWLRAHDMRVALA